MASLDEDFEYQLPEDERRERRVVFIKWLCGAIDVEAERRKRGIK